MMKGIGVPQVEKLQILKREMSIEKFRNLQGENILLNKNVLLLDDIYDSGATLTVATYLLYSCGQVKNVYVITMTKTRSVL